MLKKLRRKKEGNPREGIDEELLKAHALTCEEVSDFLKVDPASGLAKDDISGRRQQWGRNELEQGSSVKLWKLLLHHTFNFMMMVLFVALALTVATLQYIDATVIVIIIVADIVIGVIQEYKSEKSVEALRNMAAPSSQVLRDSLTQEIPAGELVPGDIVLLSQGDKIPADLRILQSLGLECDESILTGESVPVEKQTDAIEERDCPLGDRKNLAFMGTLVTKGKGKGLVVLTGTRTEIGQIAHTVANTKKQKTRLEKRMTRLGIILAISAVLCIGIVLLSLWLHDTEELYPTGLTVAVATAVALLPEALVAVVTVVLTLGVKRMAKQQALVRKMNALEQLGNVTDICSDKTGTLTQGKMMATRLWLASDKAFRIDGMGFDPHSGRVVMETEADQRRRIGDFDKEEGSEGESSSEEDDEEVDDAGDGQRNEAMGGEPGLTSTEARESQPLNLAMLVCALCNASAIQCKQTETAEEDLTARTRSWWKPHTWFRRGRKTKLEIADSDVEEGSHGGGGPDDDDDDEYTDDMASCQWIPVGSPTEAALCTLSGKLGYFRDVLDGEWETLREFPFDSTIKLMSVAKRNLGADGQRYLFTKGAPDRVLPHCRSIRIEDTLSDLQEDHLSHIQQRNEDMADEGLRVLALAYKELDDDWDMDQERDEAERDLIFLGLVGIQDPPRDGVAQAVAVCHKAGIIVHMVTGDHLSTAVAIAKQVGIIKAEDLEREHVAMISTDFDPMTDEQLDELEDLPLVIARCSPESKVKMVQQLHRRNRVVAMTGDGVNDSPAISTADIGVAMGIAGTDVTKEASDLILLDDDFCTIAKAIGEGRRTFANIRKFLVHLLAGNLAETIVMIIGIASGLYPPLNSLQILWVNLITSPPPAMLLGIEPATKDLMDKKKRPIGEAMFTVGTIVDIFFYGTLMGGLALATFVIMDEVWDEPTKSSQAACFASLTFMLLLHAYNCRRLKTSAFFDRSFPLRAWAFHLVVFLGSASVVLSIYIPGINDTIFRHEDPGWHGWVLSIGCSIIFVVVSEIYKIFRRIMRLLAYALWRYVKPMLCSCSCSCRRRRH